jgi:uncharacterized repeat protein (TIGR03803 family)
MAVPAQPSTHVVSRRFLLTNFVLLLACVLLLAAQPAQTQTFSVLHGFTGGLDGNSPMGGLTLDHAGNLYGTTIIGGPSNYGVVFKMTRHGGGWILNPLYSFAGFLDGGLPVARVVFGPDGALYGTASARGHCSECGVLFRLTPPPTPCGTPNCPWTKTTLHMFQNDGIDGEGPSGDLIFDSAGSIYGTTQYGGPHDRGVVYKLTHTSGGWTESVLYSFSGPDGWQPSTGVVFDSAGNLYGTTYQGGSSNDGVIFELTPSGSGWTETVLHSFVNQAQSPEGSLPSAGLTPDGAGSFYGTTFSGGSGLCFGVYGFGCGTVYHGAGVTIYSFTEPGLTPNGGPRGPVTLDAQGNIYGTTYQDGATLNGNVFMLTAGQLQYTSLYDFTGVLDGRNPLGNVVRHSNGNLFGTTSQGGSHSAGTVWEITP